MKTDATSMATINMEFPAQHQSQMVMMSTARMASMLMETYARVEHQHQVIDLLDKIYDKYAQLTINLFYVFH